MADQKTYSCTDCALTGCLFQDKGHPDFCVVLNMSDGFFRRGFDAQIEGMQK